MSGPMGTACTYRLAQPNETVFQDCGIGSVGENPPRCSFHYQTVCTTCRGVATHDCSYKGPLWKLACGAALCDTHTRHRLDDQSHGEPEPWTDEAHRTARHPEYRAWRTTESVSARLANPTGPALLELCGACRRGLVSRLPGGGGGSPTHCNHCGAEDEVTLRYVRLSAAVAVLHLLKARGCGAPDHPYEPGQQPPLSVLGVDPLSTEALHGHRPPTQRVLEAPECRVCQTPYAGSSAWRFVLPDPQDRGGALLTSKAPGNWRDLALYCPGCWRARPIPAAA